MANQRTVWAVAVPHLGALILTHTWDGAIKGLNEFPRQDRPNSPVVFWAFRTLVGLGLLMAAIGVSAAWLRLRGRLYTSSGWGWRRRASLHCWPAGPSPRWDDSRSPCMACCAPSTVCRRSECLASQRRWPPSLPCMLVFGTGFVFLLRLMRRPPTVGETGPQTGVPIRSAGITPAAALLDPP